MKLQNLLIDIVLVVLILCIIIAVVGVAASFIESQPLYFIAGYIPLLYFISHYEPAKKKIGQCLEFLHSKKLLATRNLTEKESIDQVNDMRALCGLPAIVDRPADSSTGLGDTGPR